MLYVTPLVTTKKIFIEYTKEEMRRESKRVTTKNQLEIRLPVSSP